MHKSGKKLLISLVASVLTGALLLGVNAAFGAPSDVPPGLAIWPTFNGVTVDGAGTGQMSITETGLYQNSATDPLTLSGNSRSVEIPSGTVFSTVDPFEAEGGINVGGPFNKQDLNVYGNTTLDSDQIIIGNSGTNLQIDANAVFNSNVTLPPGIPMDIGGDLSINGITVFRDTVDVGGGTIGAVDLNVAGNLDVIGASTFLGSTTIKNLNVTKVYGPVMYPTSTIAKTSSVTCSGKIISCNGETYWEDINIYGNYIGSGSSQTCYASAVDFIDNSGYFKAAALCLN
jgi:hypothetical protein